MYMYILKINWDCRKWRFVHLSFYSNKTVPALLAQSLSGVKSGTPLSTNDLTIDLDDLPAFVPDLKSSNSSSSTSTTSSTILSSSTFKELPYTPESLPEVTFVQHKNRDGGYFLPRQTRPVPAPEEKINRTLAWKPVPANVVNISGLLVKGQGPGSDVESDGNWGFPILCPIPVPILSFPTPMAHFFFFLFPFVYFICFYARFYV